MVNKLLQVFICVFILSGAGKLYAQVVENNPPMRQVFSTAGGTGVIANWGSLDYTIGEVVVITDSIPNSPFSSFKWLTQGFQQPDKNVLSVFFTSINVSCIGAHDGSVNLSVRSATGPVKYSWNNGDFDTIHFFSNLTPGSYHYEVKDDNFNVAGDVVITENQVDCGSELHIYSGITPNGDGHNDKWEIDGITNFSNPKVSIFNRWGDQVWMADNYNNADIIWKGTNQDGKALPAATYFYIIEAGGKIYKGWVELTL